MNEQQVDNLIMAGGTGGHIFPGLAVARALQAQGENVAWLGSQKSMEAERVPKAGIQFYGLSISGIRGKGRLKLLVAPLKLLRALWQAWVLLRRLKPKRVLGFGGFASGPGGLAAVLLGIPVYIHEQNALPGMTNKRLAPFARQVFTAFPGAFPASERVVCVGNPVREDLLKLAPPEVRYQQRSGPLQVLVIGGSLGAQALNQALPLAVALLPANQRPKIVHQAGSGKLEACLRSYKQALGEVPPEVEVTDFIEDMGSALGWADLVLCRAGALTVAEVAAAGVASVLVPYPYAVDDHQTHNARFLADREAGILLAQTELAAERLASLISGQSLDRGQLAIMASRAKSLAKPQATATIIEHLLKDK